MCCRKGRKNETRIHISRIISSYRNIINCRNHNNSTIGDVIEESRKKALEQSAYGLVETANYLALNNNALEHFTFTSEGVTSATENKLEYKGKIDATGDLYIDGEGNISLCLTNDKYYVYKNYDGEIILGNIIDGKTCISGYDALTNKYVAMLDDGTGQINNVYSKKEVDGFITNLQEQITNLNQSIGTLSDLNVSDENKGNLVSAMNEINGNLVGVINDMSTRNIATRISGVSLQTIKNPGTYLALSDCTDAPVNGKTYFVTVIGDNNYSLQYAQQLYTWEDKKIYFRIKHGPESSASYGSWYYIEPQLLS